ncbi:hypothetical protein [Piscinibacter gummiphilus]|uniref:YopX protein domain-containing protein n=1 Tax=Piscinibacter gummiphilus TaxID=946333 RepID=A0ABZ0CPR2_9BURK|nr:hypothetical protein [Piscinibacter gummiphilus]WOB06967.1 hypothetical protein RXV79_18820 [Piscinibacter gummiphilus]
MSESSAIRYELWRENEGNSYSFFPESNQSARRLLLASAELVWWCEASSWDEALVKKDLFLGLKIAYQDGSKVMVGDLVSVESGQVHATVFEIVTTEEQFQEWGVELPGVMLRCEPSDLLYLPTKSLANEPLQLLSRP